MAFIAKILLGIPSFSKAQATSRHTQHSSVQPPDHFRAVVSEVPWASRL